MSISRVLKERRKQLNYTLLDIANKVGVSEATVQRWESGNIKNLRQGRIVKLAEVLEVTPSVLMGWEEEANEYAKELLLPQGLLIGELSEIYKELISLFDCCSESGQQRILAFANNVCEMEKAEKAVGQQPKSSQELSTSNAEATAIASSLRAKREGASMANEA